VIVYRAVPYLLVAAPPTILLLAVLLGGCTMARSSEDTADRARFSSNPHSRAGEELTRELDRRAAREELRRVMREVQQ